MSSSALDIIQDAIARTGMYAAPTAAVGSSDQGAALSVNLLNQVGKDLLRRHAWQALLKEKTITTTATSEQSGALADDFDRFVANSFFNRTQNRPVVGPLTPEKWQWLQAQSATGIVHAFRLRGDALIVYPTPPASETWAYEYVSTYWCGASDDTAPTQTAILSDTDIFWLDNELMTLGLVWRLLRSKGLDYAEAFRDFEMLLAERIGNDGGSSAIDLAPVWGAPTVFDPLVPDGSWTL